MERKEYQETKVVRTLSPNRNYSSNQNVSQFDSSLNYLLEDLQNSVSRPGSSLGYTNGGSHSYRETARSIDTGRSNSLNRVTNLKSSNPMTEYSSDDAYSYKSPDGRQTVTGYKKEKYMYGTTSQDIIPEKIRTQNSINQLDNLLDDLQQVKNSSFLKTSETYSNIGTDPTHQTSPKTVNRELHYGDTPKRSTIERDSSHKRDIQYSSEGIYKDTRTVRPVSPATTSRTSTLSKQTKVTNIHDYPVEVVETVTPDIDPEVLAQLDLNLRPPGNTKVTTTIKTYTYEIPGSGDYPTNLNESTEQKYVYSPNETLTTPSKSFVYNKVENKENTVYQDSYNYPPYQKPSPPGGVLVKETITTRNYQPGYRVDRASPTTNQTYVYNESNITTKNIENVPPPMPPTKETYVYKDNVTNVNKTDIPRYPDYPTGGKQTYVYKETNTTTKNDLPFSERGYPVYNPPDSRNPPNTTYYIKETHKETTTNRPVSPYQNGHPPSHPPGKTIIYQHESTNTSNTYGPNRPRSPDVETFDPRSPPNGYNDRPRPNEPINIHYSYKSSSKTENNYKGRHPNGETESLLPRKFPTDDGPDGPPKKLDELMATFGNEPPTSPLNQGFLQHEHEKAQQKKVDSLKRQAEEAEDMQKKEPPSKTKNVSGPPVYYPPGEMFLKKEEGGEAWRAQGGYARASGRYQYEAESRSKSKSSSGAAVVPVCLPLCCGLPCALL